MFKRFLCLCLILLLAFPAALAETASAPVPTPVPGAQYRLLKQGMSGNDIYLLKIRMYQLGYLDNERATDGYTAYFKDKIKALQKANGLEETGVATPELQLLIFSPACVPANAVPAPTPSTAPSPAPIAPSGSPDLPILDEEGFLPQGSADEYVYRDAEDGLWYYISDSLYIEIKQYARTDKQKLLWYETKVSLRNGLLPTSYSEPFKKLTDSVFVSPAKIAKANGVVLGISDDTYTWRTIDNHRTGIVIRNGKVLANTPYAVRDRNRFPSLDVMAFLPNGDMAVYENGEVTPEYLLSLGVRDAYSFGPILLRDEFEPLSVRYGGEYSKSKEPRCAIGVLEPNRYVILTVTGRTSRSDGCTIPWLAERMREMGAKQAFNLDGGGSAALVFMGDILNKQSSKSVRLITDIIGFGTSNLVPRK